MEPLKTMRHIGVDTAFGKLKVSIIVAIVIHFQTPYENVFGNGWVLNGDDCDTTVPAPINICEADDAVYQDIQDTCYVFINPDGECKKVLTHILEVQKTIDQGQKGLYSHQRSAKRSSLTLLKCK